MATTNPNITYVTRGILHRSDGKVICRVGRRTGWFDWLRHPGHKSFHYTSPAGVDCTFVKRRNRRGDKVHFYWYAQKRIDGILQERYMGKAERLSLQRLEEAAHQVAQRRMVLV